MDQVTDERKVEPEPPRSIVSLDIATLGDEDIGMVVGVGISTPRGTVSVVGYDEKAALDFVLKHLAIGGGMHAGHDVLVTWGGSITIPFIHRRMVAYGLESPFTGTLLPDGGWSWKVGTAEVVDLHNSSSKRITDSVYIPHTLRGFASMILGPYPTPNPGPHQRLEELYLNALVIAMVGNRLQHMTDG